MNPNVCQKWHIYIYAKKCFYQAVIIFKKNLIVTKVVISFIVYKDVIFSFDANRKVKVHYLKCQRSELFKMVINLNYVNKCHIFMTTLKNVIFFLIPPLPSSCGSSSQNTAMEMETPVRMLSLKAAPMLSPSMKLWRPSPKMIMYATVAITESFPCSNFIEWSWNEERRGRCVKKIKNKFLNQN